MPLTIAALRTGHDPVGKLPPGAFHTQLDRQISCPRCDATYNLLVDFDASVSRHFERESHRLILMLEKAIRLGHGDDHRVAHFETSGVVVTSFLPPGAEEAEKPRPSASTQRRTPPPARKMFLA
jgi:hypothetical protein